SIGWTKMRKKQHIIPAEFLGVVPRLCFRQKELGMKEEKVLRSLMLGRYRKAIRIGKWRSIFIIVIRKILRCLKSSALTHIGRVLRGQEFFPMGKESRTRKD